MAASGRSQEFRIEDARNRCRDIYATYFYAQRTHGIRIAKLSEEILGTLTELRDIRTARITDLTKEEAFAHLTHNFNGCLNNFILRLDAAFGAGAEATEVQIHSAATDPGLLDSQHQLQYLQQTLKILIEGVKRCEARRRPRERSHSYALNDDDAATEEDLAEFLIAFFAGCPDRNLFVQLQPGQTRGYDSMQDSRRALAQLVKSKLKGQALRAMGQITSEHEQCCWRLRHAIYWLHCSTDSLRNLEQSTPMASGRRNSRRNSQEISQTNDRVAATFLDAIKSAWLLNEIGTSQYEKVNILLQQVLLGVRKKVLDQLHVYSRYFTVPDYDAISEQDLRMSISSRRVVSSDETGNSPGYSGTVRRTRTQGIPNPVPPRMDTESRVSRPMIATSGLPAGGGFRITDSPLDYGDFATPSNPRNDEFPSQYRTQRHQEPQRDVEDTRSRNSSKDLMPESSTHSQLDMSYPPLIPQRRYGSSGFLEATRRNTNRAANLEGSSSEASLRPDLQADRRSGSSGQPRTSVSSRESHDREQAGMPFSPSSLEGIIDGLHVTNLESDVLPEHISDVQPRQGEVEIENPEAKVPGKGGFFHLYSRRANGNWEISRVRIFKNRSNKTLRMWTSQNQQPPQEFEYNLQDDELVPLYAWADSGEEGAELYLRHRGQQHGFYYKFFLVDDKSEIHGFHAVSTSSNFELQLRVHGVTFARDHHPIEMRHSKIQLWTPDDGPTSGRERPGPRPQQGPRRAETTQWPPENLSTKLDELVPQRGGSKIFFFHNRKITIILVSERVHVEVLASVRHRLTRTSTRPSKVARISPTKSRGCTHVRAITIQASTGEYAGIPLDHSGIQYSDQDGDHFEDFTHVDIDFHTAENCAIFVAEFRKLRAQWEKQFANLVHFREVQRSRTISSTNKIVVDKD